MTENYKKKSFYIVLPGIDGHSWICGHCFKFNYPSRKECYTCGRDTRPDLDDWPCPKCHFKSKFYYTRSCYKCGFDKAQGKYRLITEILFCLLNLWKRKLVVYSSNQENQIRTIMMLHTIINLCWVKRDTQFSIH